MKKYLVLIWVFGILSLFINLHFKKSLLIPPEKLQISDSEILSTLGYSGRFEVAASTSANLVSSNLLDRCEICEKRYTESIKKTEKLIEETKATRTTCENSTTLCKDKIAELKEDNSQILSSLNQIKSNSEIIKAQANRLYESLKTNTIWLWLSQIFLLVVLSVKIYIQKSKKEKFEASIELFQAVIIPIADMIL